MSHHVTHGKVLQTALQSLTILSTFPGVHHVTPRHTRQSSTNSTAISYHTLHIPKSTPCHTTSHHVTHGKVLQTALQSLTILSTSPGVHHVTSCHTRQSSTNSTAISYHTLHIPRSTPCHTMSHHVTHGKVLQTALQSLTILSTSPGVHHVTPRHTRQSSTNSTAISYHTLHIPRSTPCHTTSHTAKFYKQHCNLLPYSPHPQEYTTSHHVTHGKVLQTALQSLTILSTSPGVHHVTPRHTRQSSTNSTAISYHTLHIPRSTPCHTTSHTAKFYKQHCNLLPYSPHSQEYTMSHHVTHGKVLQTALQSLTILSTFPRVHHVTPRHIMSHTAKFYKQHCNLLPYSPHPQEYTTSHHVTHGKVLQTALQSLTILSTFPGVHHVTPCHTMSHTAKFYKQHCNLLPYSPHPQEYTMSHHVTHGKVLQTALQSLTILSTFPGVHHVTPRHTRQSSTNSTAISYHTLHIPRSTPRHIMSHTAKFYKQHCNLLPYSPHPQEYTMSHHVTHGKFLQTALQSLTILSTFPGVHHVTPRHTRQSSTNSTAISYHTLHIPRSTPCHTTSHTAKFYKQHCNLLPYSPHLQEYTMSHHVTHGKVLQTALQALTILSTFPRVHHVTPCHIMSHTAKFYKQNCKLLPYSPHSQEYTMSHHVTQGKVLQTALQALTILSTFPRVHHVTPCHIMSHTAKFYKQHCNLLPYSPHPQEYTMSHHVTHGKVLQTALQSLTILSTFPGVHHVTPCHTTSHKAKFYKQHCKLLPYSPHSQEYTMSHHVTCHTRQSSTNSTAISYHTLHIPRSTPCHTTSHTAKFYKQHCNLLPYSPHSQEYTMSHHVTHGKVLQTALQSLTILSTFPGVHHVTPRHTRQSSTNSTASSYHTLHIPKSTPCHTMSHHVTHGKVLQTALQSLTILSTSPGVHHVTPCNTMSHDVTHCSSTNSIVISYHTLHIPRSTPCHFMSHHSRHVTSCHTMSHTEKFYKQHCNLLPYSPHPQDHVTPCNTMSHDVTHCSSTNSIVISYHTLHIPRSTPCHFMSHHSRHVTSCHTMSHTAKFYKQHCDLLPYSPHPQEYTSFETVETKTQYMKNRTTFLKPHTWYRLYLF